jgi:hypothetical protein
LKPGLIWISFAPFFRRAKNSGENERLREKLRKDKR